MEKPKFIEDLGQLRPKPTSRYTQRYSLYECPYCKAIFKSANRDMRRGDVQSCGCYRRTLKSAYKHGLSENKLYKIWSVMRQRCSNPKNKGYKNYGGRGIAVCEDWNNTFMSFYNWAVLNGYSENLQIDRINNDGNYEPSNCRWITRRVNTQNSRLIKSNNTSGYRGVIRSGSRWKAVIRSNNIFYYIGSFKLIEDAALAYNNWIIEYKTNHPLNIIK
jgi:hypothetical protein